MALLLSALGARAQVIQLPTANRYLFDPGQEARVVRRAAELARAEGLPEEEVRVLFWLLFTLMLFVFEPLFLHRWFQQRAQTAPEATFRLIQRMHWLLLSLSLLTVSGAVAGSHGWLIQH